VIPPVMEAIAGEEALALGGMAAASGDPARRPRGLVADSTVWPSVGAEAFRLLYSSVTQGWGDSPRTILVTSVAPLEGKTMVAANLAVTFAREGARVLLIDCDLRRPRLHKLFRVSRAPGLVDLLRPAATEEQDARPDDERRPMEHAYSMLPEVARQYEPAAAEPADAGRSANGDRNGHRPAAASPGGAQASPSFRNIRETSSPGLWLLPCGTVRRSTSETLKASAMRTLLGELASEFDVIILDTPPALASADAVILAPVANDVMLVVRAAHTDRDAVDRARQQLSDAGGNVIGAVLNDPEGKVAGDGMRYYVYGESAATE
jgi:Mrp family chromosome partitioning ATPase